MIIRAFVSVHLRFCILLDKYLSSVGSVAQLRRQLAWNGYLKWYCAKSGVVVLEESDWFWTDAENFDESCDFLDDSSFSRLLRYHQWPKLGTPPLMSYLFNFGKPFFLLECLKLCITKCYPGCSPCLPSTNCIYY